MDLVQIVVLSVVEGVTEFLPVSSTGHLILTTHLLGLDQSQFTKSFEIAIQSGAILAILVLYGKKLFLNSKILKNVFLAFLPTAILGFLFYRIVKVLLLGNLYITLIALFLGGFVLIVWERLWGKKAHGVKIEELTPLQSIMIGIIQSISFIPGVSRSAATILGGVSLGLPRSQAVELSFILAIPTMFAATGFDLIINANNFAQSELVAILIGFSLSFLVALFAVSWFVSFIKKYTFVPFGVYRIAVSILFFLIIIS